jgi:hypothetical protein
MKILAKSRELYGQGKNRHAMKILNKLVYAEPQNQMAKSLLADTFEHMLGTIPGAEPWTNVRIRSGRRCRHRSMNDQHDLSAVMFDNPGGSPPVMSYGEGIQPTQPVKSCKVAIGGVEHQSVLDGQGGQMGIWDEIGVNARHGQKVPEHLAMALRRLRNPHRLTAEPSQNLTPCVHDRFGTFEHPRVGHEPQEGQRTCP